MIYNWVLCFNKVLFGKTVAWIAINIYIWKKNQKVFFKNSIHHHIFKLTY